MGGLPGVWARHCPASELRLWLQSSQGVLTKSARYVRSLDDCMELLLLKSKSCPFLHGVNTGISNPQSCTGVLSTCVACDAGQAPAASSSQMASHSA